jgi:hypothetical protein
LLAAGNPLYWAQPSFPCKTTNDSASVVRFTQQANGIAFRAASTVSVNWKLLTHSDMVKL